jgi:preprotein translocase subunit SecE
MVLLVIGMVIFFSPVLGAAALVTRQIVREWRSKHRK